MNNTLISPDAIFIAKSEATGSYWVKNDGFTAATKEEASALTKKEVSWLHFQFYRAGVVTELINA